MFLSTLACGSSALVATPQQRLDSSVRCAASLCNDVVRSLVIEAVEAKLPDMSVDGVSRDLDEVHRRSADVLVTDDVILAAAANGIVKFTATIPKLIVAAETINYFLDRVKVSNVIPLPFEWRNLELCIATPQDCAEIIASAVNEASVVRIAGSDSLLPACLCIRPYSLGQLARACGIAAGHDVMKTPFFALDSGWLDKVAFPYDIDETWLFPEDRKPKPPPKTLARPKTNPELERRQQLADDDHRLAAVISTIYDAYTPAVLSFPLDSDLVKDGASLLGNAVYKNDKYHRQLGSPRASNPYL